MIESQQDKIISLNSFQKILLIKIRKYYHINQITD